MPQGGRTRALARPDADRQLEEDALEEVEHEADIIELTRLGPQASGSLSARSMLPETKRQRATLT